MTSPTDQRHDGAALQRYLTLIDEPDRAAELYNRATRYRATLKRHLDAIYTSDIEPIGLRVPEGR